MSHLGHQVVPDLNRLLCRVGWKEQRPSKAVPAECPRCHRPTTWAKPLPRHVRFHDTRHSGGTAVVRSSGLAVAQQFLRHSDSRLTADTYGHLELQDLQQGVLAAFPTSEEGAKRAQPHEERTATAAGAPKTTAWRLQERRRGAGRKT